MTNIYYETGRNANFGFTLHGPQSKQSACSDSAAFATDICEVFTLCWDHHFGNRRCVALNIFFLITKCHKLTFSCLLEFLISKEKREGNVIFSFCVVKRPFTPIKQLITKITFVKDTTLRCDIHI